MTQTEKDALVVVKTQERDAALAALNAAEQALTVSLAIVIDVPVPPASSLSRVKVGEIGGDGPTEALANSTLNIPWRNVRGDYTDANGVAQGPTHWATIPPSAGARWLNVALPPALIEKLRTDLTGLYISGGGFPGPWLSSRNNTDSTRRPTITVVTTTGTFACLMSADTWLAPSTNSTQTSAPAIRCPAIFVPDLSAVTGAVQSATLNVYHQAYNTTAMYVDFLDMPELLTDPAIQRPGSVVQGIAATVAKDSDLESHPDVRIYINEATTAAFEAKMQWTGTWLITREFVTNEYGLNALRVKNGPAVPNVTDNTAVNYRNLWVDRPSGVRNPLSWRKPFGQVPDRLFLRYLLKLEDDVGAILAVPTSTGLFSSFQGTKLPGFEGWPINYPDAQSWPADGFPADALSDGVYSLPEHGVPSLVNGRAMAFTVYCYDEDRRASQFHGNGRMEFPGTFCWTPNRTYCVEQEIVQNTFTNGIPNRDGQTRFWIAGVKIYERTDRLFRRYPQQGTFSAEMLIMHGGNGKPQRNQHYQISGWTVSTSYVGPPRPSVSALTTEGNL